MAVVLVRLGGRSGINPDGGGDTDSLNGSLDFSNPDKVALAVVQRDSIAEHDERAEGGDDVLGVHVDGESCVYFWNDTVYTAIRRIKRVKEGGKSASDFGDIDSLVKSDRQAICQRKSVGDEKSALLTIDPQDRKVLPNEGESWNARGAHCFL